MAKPELGKLYEQWEKGAIYRLPPLLRRIADATDYAAAIAVARASGGRRIFISNNPGEGDWLVEAVGLDKARAIASALNPARCGMYYDIPVGPGLMELRRAEVLRMSLAGESKMRIAAHLGIHHRTVQHWRARLRDEGFPIPTSLPMPNRKPK